MAYDGDPVTLDHVTGQERLCQWWIGAIVYNDNLMQDVRGQGLVDRPNSVQGILSLKDPDIQRHAKTSDMQRKLAAPVQHDSHDSLLASTRQDDRQPLQHLLGG